MLFSFSLLYAYSLVFFFIPAATHLLSTRDGEVMFERGGQVGYAARVALLIIFSLFSRQQAELTTM